MENKYFTPEIEELRVGYICEISDISYPGFGEFIIPKSDWESHEGCTMYDYLECGNLRTKYLDKEDVESLGWEKETGFHIEYGAKKGEHRIILYDDSQIGIYKLGEPYRIYYGNCPSINDLKYLMKLLNIK